jgi:glycosyltransferase involved in cell wall biosynthesis
MKISILICTIIKRRHLFDNLFSSLQEQSKPYINEVEILVESDNGEKSIGAKRNELLERATGEYVCFIDDDDEVSPSYIQLLRQAVESGKDCASLKGLMTWDGINPEVFEHSLKYKEWRTNPGSAEIKHERYPNHLSLIRSSVAKQFKFPNKNWSEDHDWSKQIHESGLLKTEYYIPEILYYYKYITNK